MPQVKAWPPRANRHSAHQILLELRKIFRKHEWVRGALFTREGAMCAMGGICEAVGIDGLTEMQVRIKLHNEWQKEVDKVRREAGDWNTWTHEKREEVEELYDRAPEDPDDLNEGKEDEIRWLVDNDRSVARAVRYLARAISLVDGYRKFEESGWDEDEPVKYIENWNDDIPTRPSKKRPIIGKELLLKVIDKAIDLEAKGK